MLRRSVAMEAVARMCGIVGLFLKHPKLEPELGALVAGMLATMTDRGPDSAGFPVYGAGRAGYTKLTLRGTAETDFAALAAALEPAAGTAIPVVRRDTHAVISIPVGREAAVCETLAALAPSVALVGAGRRMELYKE